MEPDRICGKVADGECRCSQGADHVLTCDEVADRECSQGKDNVQTCDDVADGAYVVKERSVTESVAKWLINIFTIVLE